MDHPRLPCRATNRTNRTAQERFRGVRREKGSGPPEESIGRTTGTIFFDRVLQCRQQEKFLCPMLECSCLFCTRESFEKIDARTNVSILRAGSLNIHVYTQLAALPESRLWCCCEGSFHQFHGGVTTAESPSRARSCS
jgi:hypothetical protein